MWEVNMITISWDVKPATTVFRVESVSSTLEVAAAGFNKTLVPSYQVTWHIPEDLDLEIWNISPEYYTCYL
jgi:hypothetical protein